MGDGMRQMGDPYMMQGNYPMQNSMQRPYEGDPSYGHSGMHPQKYEYIIAIKFNHSDFFY